MTHPGVGPLTALAYVLIIATKLQRLQREVADILHQLRERDRG